MKTTLNLMLTFTLSNIWIVIKILQSSRSIQKLIHEPQARLGKRKLKECYGQK